MKQEYLQYQFTDSAEFVSTFDELPLWSASFGLLLLKHLELRPNISVLDIGSGAGFPLLELAQRLGTSCKCYGLDPWKNANDRARKKIENYGVTNAEVTEGTAEQMPFGDDSIDLIVSSLGINNFENPDKAINECNRVLKPGGRIAITTNLYRHWLEFYNLFEKTALELGKKELAEKLKQEHRGTLKSVSDMLSRNQFTVTRYFEESLEMKFLNGSAFLNHYFIKLGWLGSWLALIPEIERASVFTLLEKNLNSYAHEKGGLSLTVPMLYIEAQKQYQTALKLP